ncbi:MAG: hypothetical protein JEY94_01560 [Melioribacteraceae bacterium]|nr:hypothetical protein [Melioribacteraceae bacterium]
MMFRIISVLALVISIVWIIKVLKQLDLSISEALKIYFDELKTTPDLFKKNDLRANGSTKRVFTVITLLLFDLLFLTGFFPVIFFGIHLSGILLLLHVAVAPLFAVSLMILLVISAESNKFNESEIQFEKGLEVSKSGISKILFWLLAIVSLPLMLSIVLGMYPIFGTEGQANLLELHRYSVLLFSILVFLQIGFILRIQKENK